MTKKGKLEVKYRDSELRVHGENAGRFTSKIGSIVRHHAPLQYGGWGKIPENQQNECIRRLKVFFFSQLLFITVFTTTNMCFHSV